MAPKQASALALAVAAVLLLVALAPLPYGYYTFLRIAVAGATIWSLAVHWESVPVAFKATLIVLGIIFNPVIPLHFRREVWQVIDAVGAVLLGGAADQPWWWVAILPALGTLFSLIMKPEVAGRMRLWGVSISVEWFVGAYVMHTIVATLLFGVAPYYLALAERLANFIPHRARCCGTLCRRRAHASSALAGPSAG